MLKLSLGTKTKSFEYDGSTSKIAAVTENGVRRTVGYDAAGNETTYNTNTYSPRNQLTDVSYGTNHLYLFKYHAGGVRTIAEWNYQWEPQTYFYTPEMNLLSFTKQRMPGVSRPDMTEDVVWFGGMPVGQKFIAVNNGSTRWTVPDHLGTPLLQTDSSGNVVWRAEYEPYGQVWSMTTGNRTDQPLRFPGQEDSYDENGNAVYYNIFRWYGAGWGRYTQADPLPMRSAVQPFAYSSGNPVSSSDALGLWDIDDASTLNWFSNMDSLIKTCKGIEVGGACSFVSAYVSCNCKEGPCGFRAEATLHIRGTINVFAGDFSRHVGRSVDPNVHDPASAFHHEYNYHIDPATAAVASQLDQLEAREFQGEHGSDECFAECDKTSLQVQKAFLDKLQQTQTNELRRARAMKGHL